MLKIIMQLVRNRNCTFTTGNGPKSRLQRLKSGVPQGSVLILFYLIFIATTYLKQSLGYYFTLWVVKIYGFL